MSYSIWKIIQLVEMNLFSNMHQNSIHGRMILDTRSTTTYPLLAIPPINQHTSGVRSIILLTMPTLLNLLITKTPFELLPPTQLVERVRGRHGLQSLQTTILTPILLTWVVKFGTDGLFTTGAVMTHPIHTKTLSRIKYGISKSDQLQELVLHQMLHKFLLMVVKIRLLTFGLTQLIQCIRPSLTIIQLLKSTNWEDLFKISSTTSSTKIPMMLLQQQQIEKHSQISLVLHSFPLSSVV